LPPWGTPGSDDVDQIVNFLLDRVMRRHGVDLSANQVVRLRLRDAAQTAKAELVSAPVACVRVPFLEVGANGPIHLDTTLTPTDLQQITGTPLGPHDAVGPSKPRPAPKTSVPTSSTPQTNVSPVRVVVALVTVFVVCGVAAGIWWGSAGSSTSGSGQTTASPDSCVKAVECIPQVVADLVQAVGGPQFVEIWLRDDGRARAEAPSAPGATTVDRFTWNAGDVERDGPIDNQPRPQALRDTLFDVTTVDWPAVATLVAQIPQLGGTTEVKRGVSVTVSRSSYAEVAQISLRDADSGTSVTADSAGRIVKMSGGVPGSPAATWKVLGFYALVPQVVDDLVAAAGSTQFVELHFSPSNARARVQLVPDAYIYHWFTWSYGIVQRDSGNGSLRPDTLFDVTAVDWTAAAQLAAQMPTLTLAPSDVAYGVEDLELTVRRPKSDDERRATTEAVFVFTAESDNTTTTIVADARGQIVWMHGGAPGSPAAKWAPDHP